MGKTSQSIVCSVVLWISASLLVPQTVSAQRFGDIGVRAQGMADTFVAVADDATATWWNPAGLATGLSFVDLAIEADQHGSRALAIAFPSLGLSYYHLNISQIQPLSSTGSTGSDRQDLGAAGSGLPAAESVGIDQFGVTVGQSIGGHLAVGSTLKLVRANSTTRADLDVGAMAALGVVRLGIVIRNVSAPEFGTGTATFGLSRRARAGVAVLAPPRGRLDRIALAVDADLTTANVNGRNERDVSGGAEVWLLSRRLGVRGGVGKNTVGDAGSFGAWGFSVAPYPRFFIDGAMVRGQEPSRDRSSVDVRVTF
jgi:hypothetical protein